MERFKNPFRMNLQLFAEEDGAAGNPNSGGDSNAGAEAQQRRFTQEDVDRIVNQRLARQQRDIDSRIENARQEGRTEAERLANMTQEQRMQHEREQNETAMREREAALNTREAEIARRELRAEAIETLAARGLPRDLEQILVYTSAEACSQSIAAVEKAFRDAVKAEVDKQLSGSAVELRRAGGTRETEPEGVQLARKIGKAEADNNKTARDILSHYM